jgi:Arc/MetJ family transcription regulator
MVTCQDMSGTATGICFRPHLDLDLVAQAREVLGSNGTTDTVHRALEEVVRQEKLRWLAERDFSELTPEKLRAS